MDLDLGDTRIIIETCRRYGALRNQAAYILATAYWETAHTMLPVEEAYWVHPDDPAKMDGWRRRNLRYYPWHGRGYVQVTWEQNYRRVKTETGADTIAQPDLLMTDKDVSAVALVKGCLDGWWTGKRIGDYITLQRSDYVGARRVVNGTDKAQAIAEIAREYEVALKASGYGVEKTAPVINERRDGSAPRVSITQSTTAQAVCIGGIAQVGQMVDEATGMVGQLTEQLGVQPNVALGALTLLALTWIFRERLRKMVEGDR